LDVSTPAEALYSARANGGRPDVLIRPGITREDRQKFLNRLDLYTRVDPEEYLRIFGFASSFALAGAGVPPAARGTRAAEEAASEAGASAEAQAVEAGATTDAPSKVWTYGWARRGREIHDRFSDRSLHPNFPVIDDFPPSGVATSYKSIDLNAATYQNNISLKYRLDNYFDMVSEFDGATFAGNIVSPDQIARRALHLIIPKGSMTDAQKIVVEAARLRASSLKNPVDLIVTPY
jgi:hypothetical protein